MYLIQVLQFSLTIVLFIVYILHANATKPPQSSRIADFLYETFNQSHMKCCSVERLTLLISMIFRSIYYDTNCNRIVMQHVQRLYIACIDKTG
ncbi:unnamed protein product [Albugo candida]|uniref:Uncharacterized protein n=1 Tax=Albugo candida TaxID=65357 RepID=A0A024FTA4_9STRA|nr:unnamed protein product [Albugo candida]|eukprot:CCI10236.1 unnamed protein product [Albugo candida]